MPSSPVFFSVVADYKAFIEDAASDSDYDPQQVPVGATVTFTPLVNAGDVVRAVGADPRPVGYIPAPVVALIDPSDGRLKLRKTADSGGAGSFAEVRLLGTSDLLELDGPLFYTVSFSGVTFSGGRRGSIAGFTFEAPSTDTEVNLISVGRAAGQPAENIQKIAPGGVRLSGGDIVFSFAGVDIPDPISFNPDFTSTEITDASATGRDLITAETASDARGVIDAEYTGNKGVANGYAPLDASAKIDSTYLPSYVDDVVEAANLAAFPGTGETGKIYVALDTGDSFRWSGSTYVWISDRVTAANITDSTGVGRSLVTATDAGAARSAISAEYVGVLTAVKTAAYTAAVGDIVPADATSGGFTVTLPAAPANGSRVIVKKIDSTANTVLVQRSGSDVFNTSGGPSSLQLTVASQVVVMSYHGGIWAVVSDTYGLAAMDGRFAPLLTSQMLDTNGIPIVQLNAVTNAVNYLKISNNIAATSPPTLEAVGPGSNIGLRLQAKAANVEIYTTETQAGLAAGGTGATVNLNLVSKGPGSTVRANNVVVVDVSTAQNLTYKDLTSGTNTFPTLNQNTTGSAATLTTARNIDGVSFDGSANVTVIAPATHAASGKTIPVDADEIPLVDSGASNVLAKITLANLKAAIFTRSIQTLTSTATLGDNVTTDYVVFVGASGAPTLPTAVGNTSRYTIKNVHTTDKTVSTTSSQTIDGSTTLVIKPGDSFDIVSDGTVWRIV